MDIEQLRQYCLSFPAVCEEVKWGNDLVFTIGQKMFCVASLEPPFRFSFKVADEDFEAMSVREGFVPAPYLARAKWVLLQNPASVSKKETETLVHKSYQLVSLKLTKKVKSELGL
jgi:predicted DNA-binding protein (MmcQ/YjbR family)